jgi:hypothetical protein
LRVKKQKSIISQSNTTTIVESFAIERKPKRTKKEKIEAEV